MSKKRRRALGEQPCRRRRGTAAPSCRARRADRGAAIHGPLDGDRLRRGDLGRHVGRFERRDGVHVDRGTARAPARRCARAAHQSAAGSGPSPSRRRRPGSAAGRTAESPGRWILRPAATSWRAPPSTSRHGCRRCRPRCAPRHQPIDDEWLIAVDDRREGEPVHLLGVRVERHARARRHNQGPRLADTAPASKRTATLALTEPGLTMAIRVEKKSGDEDTFGQEALLRPDRV